MHKKEFTVALGKFVATYDTKKHGGWKGQKAFAEFLIWHFGTLTIPSDEKYDFWRIEHYLPKLLVDAFERLRTSPEPEVVPFRHVYEEETEHRVPNIIDVEDGSMASMLAQSSAIQTTLCFMLKEVFGENHWVIDKVDSYCRAQWTVVQQTFDKFLRLVYRRGLGDMVNKCEERSMSGKFGETDLRTYIMAGRIMFTFARRKEGETNVYFGDKHVGTLPYQEDSVSFVGEDGDPLCLSAGIQSAQADFHVCLDMIEEVIKHWPAEPKEQKKIFKADSKVSIL